MATNSDEPWGVHDDEIINGLRRLRHGRGEFQSTPEHVPDTGIVAWSKTAPMESSYPDRALQIGDSITHPYPATVVSVDATDDRATRYGVQTPQGGTDRIVESWRDDIQKAPEKAQGKAHDEPGMGVGV